MWTPDALATSRMVAGMLRLPDRIDGDH
jgi:hypothetical protein